MTSLAHADIFFLVTTVFVVVLTIVLAVCGIYLVQILRNFRDISIKLKRGVSNIEGHIEDAYGSITESAIFKFLFGKKVSRKKVAREE